MNSDLEQVKEWLLANKLSLNVAKTEFLLIGSHHKLRTLPCKPSISIDNKELKQVQQSRVLGVEIDEHLNWDQHIDSLAKKVSSGIGAMKRISEFANQNTLVSIYNAIIQPHLNYCSEDVREEFERDVSRIAGSIHVPPDTVRMSNVLTHVNQGVGYRASIMADRILTELDKPDHKELRQLTRVYILEGSIFKWGNELKPLIDAHGSKTVHVHGVAAAWKLLLWPELRG
ncbi:predicted protein [Nematostella vectensis]|uniref:Rhodanese domain-containing protein n=1 Tax=Nematostella vectensis TaxID=45351 RepID=A7SKL2_NEMVE|nr:predicted protein [Nematostella vectensis]|eukprot:XP_001647514.1 predicted protein [Nematostella vectensis]